MAVRVESDHSGNDNNDRHGWHKGVRNCRTGVKKIVHKFPKPTYDFGQSILASFNAQVDGLQHLTNNSSPILAIQSINILKALSLLSDVKNTPSSLLDTVEQTLTAKSSAYHAIITNLTQIGKLDKPVGDVVLNVQNSLFACIKQFNRRLSVQSQDSSERIDIKDLMQSARLNLFTISFIAAIALNSGNKFANETFEAIAILSFIANLQTLAVHGVNANMGSVLVSETDNVSQFLLSCYETLNPLVAETTNLVYSSSFNDVDKTKSYLADFVRIISSGEKPLAKLLGAFEGVSITEAKVNENLAKKI